MQSLSHWCSAVVRERHIADDVSSHHTLTKYALVRRLNLPYCVRNVTSTKVISR